MEVAIRHGPINADAVTKAVLSPGPACSVPKALSCSHFSHLSTRSGQLVVSIASRLFLNGRARHDDLQDSMCTYTAIMMV